MELIILGIVVGILSGFFGIGGGTILVPSLLFFGYSTKVAIGISVVQMVFSSIFGSYINQKKGTLNISLVLFIGLGGFVGALLSGYITSLLSSKALEMIFLSFAFFALARLFFHIPQPPNQKENINKVLLFIIGIPIGVLSMSIGVGGSILVVPLLVGFFHVPLKEATSAGLFFVIFSSNSGFISHFLHGTIDIFSGVIIGIASLLGVYIGIHLKGVVKTELQKKLLMLFYVVIISYLSLRILGYVDFKFN